MTVRRDARAPIYLVGFMGSGKSVVGERLAARLGWACADTDAMVVAAIGRSIETVFRESGEGAFREAEWDALRSLAGRERVVVATGGGLFACPKHRDFIRENGISCWLDAPLEVVLARVGTGATRPLWPRGDGVERRAFYERRRATYALADLRVDAGSRAPDDVAAEIEARRRTLFH